MAERRDEDRERIAVAAPRLREHSRESRGRRPAGTATDAGLSLIVIIAACAALGWMLGGVLDVHLAGALLGGLVGVVAGFAAIYLLPRPVASDGQTERTGAARRAGEAKTTSPRSVPGMAAMSVSCHRPSGQRPTSSRAHRCARAARHPDHLTELGSEVIAHRLRTLGHPVRLRLMRALDRREASVEQLASELHVPIAVAAAHLRLLCRAGVVSRTDQRGPARYCLADWPSLWLVDQLARRMRGQAQRDGEADDPHAGGHG